MRRLTKLFLFVLTAVLLSSTFAAAAQEEITAAPRTIVGLPVTFASGIQNYRPMPDSGDGINMDNDFTEAGETLPSCTKGANIGSDSAWFMIVHPGGTLDINTAYATGSTFDSIVQVFAADTQNIANLHEVACDDDSGGGSGGNDARVLTVLPSAEYIVRIACLNCSVGVGPSDLALELRFIPPVNAAPTSDIINQMVPITFNKAVRVNNIEFATVAGPENSTLGCSMSHSVWHRFIAPRSGSYTFSTFGTVLNRDFQSQDTKIAVYSSSGGPVFANMTQLGCNDDSGGVLASALNGVTISEGTEVYVRVGTFSTINLLAGSYYRITVSPESIYNLGVNSSFDSGTTSWAVKGTTIDDGVFNDGGDNVFRLFGAPNKSAKIKQSIGLASLLLTKAESGSLFRLIAIYRTVGASTDRAKFILRVFYSDGTPPTKVSFKPLKSTLAYVSVGLFAEAASKNVSKVVVMAKNSSAQGEFRISNLYVTYSGNPARLRDEKAPLALPVPGSADLTGFRGGN
jgi:hypothetical protein